MPLPKENNLPSYDILDIIVKTDERICPGNGTTRQPYRHGQLDKDNREHLRHSVRLGLLTGTEAQFVRAVTAAITAATNATSAAQAASQAVKNIEGLSRSWPSS